MLSLNRIKVNGVVCQVANKEVAAGDLIEIGPRKIPLELPPDIKVFYEDSHLIIVQKPAGLLTVATLDEREETLYYKLREYLKDSNPKNKLFIVHRLDKFASGILVFAKSEKVQSELQDIFSRHDIQRKYWAIVEGKVEKNQGTIESRIAEDRSMRMHSTNNATKGKTAITHFRVLRRWPRVTALEVTLETGRKNQIRVHLSEAGHPIVGDKSYGSKTNTLGRLGLHAFRLGFEHPITGENLDFQTETPPEFKKYL
jgi:23S rRNA pseudouridine1911/1915/1917 synthase